MLTRESIKNGLVQRMIAEAGVPDALPEAEIIASCRETLANAPDDGDVWVFGYGSLIWNPAFHYEQRRVARLYGYHRKFCLWTYLGRGSQQNPGLTLALERGGSCKGVAFRVAREVAREELEIIWRREMVTGAYCPRWVRIVAGGKHIAAVTFVVNRAHMRYEGDISEERAIAAIASARGAIGPCAEYLHNTVRHLGELGIHDGPMMALREKVERYCREQDVE